MSNRFSRRTAAPVADEPEFDLVATLAAYSVTTLVGSHPRPTGLPARLAVPVAVTPTDLPPPAPGDQPALVEAPVPTAIELAEREGIALELLDVDGTAYLYRAVVVSTGDDLRVLVPVGDPRHLVGADALSGASQVVAVVHRNDESWILTAQVRSQEWSDAGVTILLSPPKHALSVPRRVHERVQINARVAFESHVEVSRASIVDISASGASVRVEGAGMPPTDPFEVVVLMPDPITVHATVINSRLDPHAPGSQIWHLQFVAVTPVALHRLVALSGTPARGLTVQVRTPDDPDAAPEGINLRRFSRGTAEEALTRVSAMQELSLPPEPSSVRQARRFLQALLGPDADADAGALAVLLLSELATNAVLHAGTTYTVHVELDPDRLRAEVSDASRLLPMVKNYSATAVTGRGLQMVANHSSRWGVDRRTDGKTVWFELDAHWERAGAST